MYVEPLIAMLLELPLPAVPAVAPVELAPPVEAAAPGLVDDVPLAPEPMRALVSVYCAPLVRDVVDAEPAVPLVPVAPAVPLALPPWRHPVTVIARLLEEV